MRDSWRLPCTRSRAKINSNWLTRSPRARAGGLYGYEQQRIMFPSVDNPLAQPWSAFSQPELARVAAYSIIETLISKYLAKRMLSAVTAAERASAEQAAREEVARAIAEYCAAQPNRGAGIQICISSPVIR